MCVCEWIKSWIGAELNNNEYIFILSENYTHVCVLVLCTYVYTRARARTNNLPYSYGKHISFYLISNIFLISMPFVLCMYVRIWMYLSLTVSMTWHKWAPNNLSSNLFITFICTQTEWQYSSAVYTIIKSLIHINIICKSSINSLISLYRISIFLLFHLVVFV